jgi:D-lactate dehydrogenase
MGHAAEKVIGANGVKSISVAAEKLTGMTLPKWNHSIPNSDSQVLVHAASGSPRGTRLWAHQRLESLDSKNFIYFPSCISRQLGLPKSSIIAKHPRGTNYSSLSQTLLLLADRAHLSLHMPPDTEGYCCGMPFASKGYATAYKAMLHPTLLSLWRWSEGGKYPIVIDTTSCTHSLRTCSDGLGDEDKQLWKQLAFLDVVEFLYDFVLPRLDVQPLDEAVVLHPNCSARKLGLDSKMLALARQCARSATVPLNLGCCAFAGDRGLLFPELTASATEKEAAEVLSRDYQGYYSSNIPCEIGMSEGTGKDYTSIVYLVERASRK